MIICSSTDGRESSSIAILSQTKLAEITEGMEQSSFSSTICNLLICFPSYEKVSGY